MPKAFTSGENTADIPAERKINGNGLWIFAGILVLFLLVFTLFMGGFIATNAPVNNGAANSNSRAQP